MIYCRVFIGATEYNMDAYDQLERLLSRLSHEETQRMTAGELETLMQMGGASCCTDWPRGTSIRGVPRSRSASV